MKMQLFLCLSLIASSPVFANEHLASNAAARAIKDGADYRSPIRSYVTVSSSWHIYVEKPLMDRKPELAMRAIAKLEDALAVVFNALPGKPGNTLRRVNFYLMWGKDSPQGGKANGLSYIRKGEPNNYPHLDPRWEHSIVIFSADNLLYLDELWTRKSLMHELAHAWHISNWPEKHPVIYEAWQQSQNKKLYRNMSDYKGKPLTTAYANKNQLEYFAELSAMYFVGGNYRPFNRSGLQAYDLAGYTMIESLWGVAD